MCCSGCQQQSTPTAPGNPVVFFNVTTDGSADMQRLDMAMKLAGFALDEKRNVFIFFNVKGVNVPTKSFSADKKFQDNKPIKDQLAKLIERGAKVHVCPICMKGLGVEKSDLVEGAEVTTRKALFDRIGPGTTVFTY